MSEIKKPQISVDAIILAAQDLYQAHGVKLEFTLMAKGAHVSMSYGADEESDVDQLIFNAAAYAFAGELECAILRTSGEK